MSHRGTLFWLFVWLITFSGAVFAQGEESAEGWPRSYKSGGNQVIVYQPQLDEWQDYKLLIGKAAVVVELQGQSQEYYGAIDLQATTEVDFDSRTVLMKKLEISKQTFPNIDEKLADKCQQVIKSSLPIGKSTTISLDRVLAGLERTAKQTKAILVNLEPPPIYHSETPAVLVMFMGEPKFEEVPGVADLLYAVNTNWDILLEFGTTNYYLLHGRSWLKTKDLLHGPWQATTSLPKSFQTLPDDNNWKEVKQNVPGVRAETVPRVITSTRPAELILTDGTSNYSPITGTSLLYATNTESDVFLHPGNGEIYFLTAGRWFKAKQLSGPWTAASENLPMDFTKIPADHKKAHVLSSIPGTPEADAAVLLASVPRKATVDRKNTTVKVAYEGDPEFVEISGTTSKVYYAVNTPFSVFRVEKKFYTVHNGVWFVSLEASGPWHVCTLVPASIYSIPATHPKHNVVYVYVYDSTPDTVVVGYTSGYSGTYVATTGVIMFGLGYWWAYDDHYHHYHHYHYHSHYYAYGCAARYDYYHGGYYYSGRYYGPHGGSAGGWAGYDPGSGTYYRGGYASGPHGRAFAREAYNPYTDRYAAQAGAKTPYGSWGRTVVADGNDWVRGGHRSQGDKTVGAIETSKGGKAVARYDKSTDRGAVVGKDKYGDVYVGRDGNVYKRSDDGWQKNTGKGWSDVDTSAARSSAQSRADASRSKVETSPRTRPESTTSPRTRPDSSSSKTRLRGGGSRYSSQGSSYQRRSSNLNREYQNRSRGNSRASTYQQRSRTRSGGGGFGGGRRR